MLELNRLYNMDCMKGMAEFPDSFFDLAIVDPPYGIGADGQKIVYAKIRSITGKNMRGKTGTLHRLPLNIFESLNGYRKRRSFGAETISFPCSNKEEKAGLFGIKDNVGLLCLIVNWHIRVLTRRRAFSH